MSTTLLPCPFSTDSLPHVLTVITRDNGWRVACSCSVRGPIEASSESAIESWNTRPPVAERAGEAREVKHKVYYVERRWMHDVSRIITPPSDDSTWKQVILASDHNRIVASLLEVLASQPVPRQGERCHHGVLLGDHCYKCAEEGRRDGSEPKDERASRPTSALLQRYEVEKVAGLTRMWTGEHRGKVCLSEHVDWLEQEHAKNGEIFEAILRQLALGGKDHFVVENIRAILGPRAKGTAATSGATQLTTSDLKSDIAIPQSAPQKCETGGEVSEAAIEWLEYNADSPTFRDNHLYAREILAALRPQPPVSQRGE